MIITHNKQEIIGKRKLRSYYNSKGTQKSKLLFNNKILGKY